MGIMDIFKAKENKQLKQELEEIKELLTPEQNEISANSLDEESIQSRTS